MYKELLQNLVIALANLFKRLGINKTFKIFLKNIIIKKIVDLRS